MTLLRITLLGKLSLEYGEEHLDDIESQKAYELLSYLFLYRNQNHSRESLANLLWADNRQAKAYLRKVLWQIQSTISECDDSLKDILIVDSNWVQLNSQVPFWLDTIALEDTFSLVKGASGSTFTSQVARRVQEAVSLYNGDLLQGWYMDWCILERERFQQMFLTLLDKLMTYEKTEQDYETAWMHGMRILRYDPLREHTHRELMELFYLAGNRTEALKQYHRCVALLDKELGVGPAPETEALHQQIRNNTLSANYPHGESPNPQFIKDDRLTSLNKLLRDLKQIQTALGVVQERVQTEIEIAQSVPRD